MTILVTGERDSWARGSLRFTGAGIDCRALVRPGKAVPVGATPCGRRPSRCLIC